MRQNIPKTFDEAASDCTALGMSLAKYDSDADKYDAILAKFGMFHRKSSI